MKKDEKGITMLQLLLVGLVIVVVIVVGKTLIARNQKTEKIITSEESKAFDEWNGVYLQGNNAITLIRNGKDKIKLIVSKYNSGIEIDSKTIPLNSDTKLIYEGKEKMELEKTSNGLKCNVLKAKEDSELKGFDGEYQVQDFPRLGWTGVYHNGGYTICMAELELQRLNITVNSSLEVWETEIEEYTENEIIYNADLTGAGKHLYITKEGENIKVEASSNNKDSVLNKIDGIFSK